MIVLSSDTSTKSISVCISEDDKVLSQYTGNKGMTHSAVHMPLVRDLLLKANISAKDVDLYACTIGPGSYTGIRIGVTTTKAMAYASGKDAVGVSTLHTLALAQDANKRLTCPVLDARNRRVFGAAFFEGEIVISEGNYGLDEFIEHIYKFLRENKQRIEGLMFCGDGVPLCENDPKLKEFLSLLKSKGLIEQWEFIRTDPNAVIVGQIALAKYKENDSSDNKFSPFNLNANYISKSSAQRLKDKK